MELYKYIYANLVEHQKTRKGLQTDWKIFEFSLISVSERSAGLLQGQCLPWSMPWILVSAISDKNLRLYGARLTNYEFDPLSNRAGTVSPPELQGDQKKEWLREWIRQRHIEVMRDWCQSSQSIMLYITRKCLYSSKIWTLCSLDLPSSRLTHLRSYPKSALSATSTFLGVFKSRTTTDLGKLVWSAEHLVRLSMLPLIMYGSCLRRNLLEKAQRVLPIAVLETTTADRACRSTAERGEAWVFVTSKPFLPDICRALWRM